MPASVCESSSDSVISTVWLSGPKVRTPGANRVELRRREGGQKRLHAALEVEIVVNLLHGGGIWKSIEKPHCAK